MHTLSSRRKSNINAIIDKQRHIVSPCDGVQFLGCLDKDASVAGLVSVLNNRDSWKDVNSARKYSKVNVPPFKASSTTLQRSPLPRMAGVESVTK